MTREEGCWSDLTFDRLLTGELDGKSSAVAIREHIAGCARCTARFEELRLDRERFASVIDVKAEAARTRLRAGGRIRTAATVAIAALAASVIVAIALPRPEESIRTKGSAAISVYVKEGTGAVREVSQGEALAPGAEIRFLVSADRPGYLLILGLDTREVSAYEPSAGVAKPIGAGRHEAPEGSLILDDVRGPERIFALICEEAVAPDRAMAAAREALARAGGDPSKVGSIDLDCRQSSFLIQKVQ
jgi:hypothetical protein